MDYEVELLEALEFIRDTEVSKPISEMDTDLIIECVDFILELAGKNAIFTEKDIENRLENIFNRK